MPPIIHAPEIRESAPVEFDLMHDPDDAMIAYLDGTYAPHRDGCPAALVISTTGTDTPLDSYTCPPPDEEPDPEEPPDVARLVEARFAVETARAHLGHVADRLRSDEGGAWYLSQALAELDRATSALP